MTQKDNEIFEAMMQQLVEDKDFNKAAHQFSGGEFIRRMAIGFAAVILGLIAVFVAIAVLPSPWGVFGGLAGLGIVYFGIWHSPLFRSLKYQKQDKSGKGNQETSAYMKNLEERWEQRRSNG